MTAAVAGLGPGQAAGRRPARQPGTGAPGPRLALQRVRARADSCRPRLGYTAAEHAARASRTGLWPCRIQARRGEVPQDQESRPGTSCCALVNWLTTRRDASGHVRCLSTASAIRYLVLVREFHPAWRAALPALLRAETRRFDPGAQGRAGRGREPPVTFTARSPSGSRPVSSAKKVVLQCAPMRSPGFPPVADHHSKVLVLGTRGAGVPVQETVTVLYAGSNFASSICKCDTLPSAPPGHPLLPT